MAQAPGQRVETYAAAVSGLERLEPNPDKRLKYLDFIETYAALDDDERRIYQQTHRRESDTMSAYFDRLREEGRQKGRHQAASDILLRQLQRKFGELPQEVLSRLEQADPDTLIEWSDRVISAERIDDVVH